MTQKQESCSRREKWFLLGELLSAGDMFPTRANAAMINRVKTRPTESLNCKDQAIVFCQICRNKQVILVVIVVVIVVDVFDIVVVIANVVIICRWLYSILHAFKICFYRPVLYQKLFKNNALLLSNQGCVLSTNLKKSLWVESIFAKAISRCREESLLLLLTEGKKKFYHHKSRTFLPICFILKVM